MWSLGVTFYCILFEVLPFYDDLLIKLFEQIEKGEYSIPKEHKDGYEIHIPIIKKLLQVNPKDRFNIS